MMTDIKPGIIINKLFRGRPIYWGTVLEIDGDNVVFTTGARGKITDFLDEQRFTLMMPDEEDDDE